MLTVSIVIPTKNESQDIRETIETCLRLDGPLREIIVVDDSNDDTPDIVGEYVSDQVILIRRKVNRNGCCGARSEGARVARGEICVLLNADARPDQDFLTRILPHYESGADFLVVESRVRNKDNTWGGYLQARSEYYACADPEWSEGFSCRTTAAIAVNRFPGDYPLPFCRDYLLGMELRAAGFKRHLDRSIIVEHTVPDTLGAYWNNWVWRGTFLAPTFYFIRHRSIGYISARTILKVLYELGRLSTIVWPVTNAIGLRRHLGRDVSVLSLFAAVIVTHSAMAVGNVKSLWRLLRHVASGPRVNATSAGVVAR